MSSVDWTSVPKDAFNWIADGLLSYCAAMKEIIDNTLEGVYIIRAWDHGDWLPCATAFIKKIKFFLISTTKHVLTDIDTGFTYFLRLFATALFGVFGLGIAFYMVFLAMKFLQWICFGRRIIYVKLAEYDSVRHQSANGLQRGGGNVSECHQWFKQAMDDLEAARNDFEGNIPAPEWVCFKCHQASTYFILTTDLQYD